jgi:cyanate permease
MLAELAILGVLATALVQWLKQKYASKAVTLAILVVISFILAVGVWLIQENNLWTWFLGIMATANLIYSFIVQHFENMDLGWDLRDE